MEESTVTLSKRRKMKVQTILLYQRIKVPLYNALQFKMQQKTPAEFNQPVSTINICLTYVFSTSGIPAFLLRFMHSNIHAYLLTFMHLSIPAFLSCIPAFLLPFLH